MASVQHKTSSSSLYVVESSHGTIPRNRSALKPVVSNEQSLQADDTTDKSIEKKTRIPVTSSREQIMR